MASRTERSGLALLLSDCNCFHATRGSVWKPVSESCGCGSETNSVETCFDIGSDRVLRQV